jgi:hypothetical protein
MKQLGIAVCILVAVAAEGHAQTRPRSFELTVAGVWTGGSSLGRDEATETRNQTGGGDFTLFVGSTDIEPGVGAEARLAFYVTDRIAIEGGGLFARQRVSTRLTNDAENAPNVTAEEDLDEYVIDGAIVFLLQPLGRIVPFVRAGAGYLRQLHEDQSLAETGVAYHAGGGVSYWLGSVGKGFVKRWGLRGDARLLIRDGGFSLDDEVRTGAVVTGALVMAF